MNRDVTEKQILWQGRFLNMAMRDDWEFADRGPDVRGIVAMVAVTDQKQLIVNEQFRPPVDRPVLELPAGLVGDDPQHASESLEEAARRELLEETGYEAQTLRHLFRGAPSAGTSSELVDFFLATDLNRTGPGGGTESEQITVHLVPVAGLKSWLEDQTRRREVVIDAKLYAALPFIEDA
ncbi:MAG: NUDIX hydrolase [Phycisphaeraceae bacterium]|nr:NUDIX hydrolase [Phycisphaeraceae bacterium]